MNNLLKKTIETSNNWRVLPTSVHGVLDYATVGSLVTAPRLFGWSRATRMLLTGSAGGLLGYSLCTHYELGVVKALPMPWRLALDAASGALLCGAPLALRNETTSAKAALIGFGLFEMVAALTTQLRPSIQTQIAAAEYPAGPIGPLFERAKPTLRQIAKATHLVAS
ncbi:MAG: hypothetical protein ABI068_14835 [Ktedonobacterales bacterium]